jgi:hypothetical protein
MYWAGSVPIDVEHRKLAYIRHAIAVEIRRSTVVNVTSVGDSIAVAVITRRVVHALSNVTHVADAIRLAIILPWIGQVAIVAYVAHAVAVVVPLVRLGLIGAVIAGISNIIAIAIPLLRVGYQGAVVTVIRNAVTITIGIEGRITNPDEDRSDGRKQNRCVVLVNEPSVGRVGFKRHGERAQRVRRNLERVRIQILGGMVVSGERRA